ncbi:MAG: transcription-repair coupling factor [Gammaproteobacteria bacterium]|nr:transcription-repair coupling factor [Gammaproteobacteria bacterium]
MSRVADTTSHSPLAPPLPPPGQVLNWKHLPGSARAIAIAAAARAHAGISLVIAATPASAYQLETELRFFAPELNTAVFPDWETLPYDHFSPYQDIVSSRISQLASLSQWNKGVLIVAATTLLHRIAPRQWLLGQSFELRNGQRLEREAFRERLTDAGYRFVSEVLEHGDFSLRGSLIDIYPMGADTPVRIDLFDDEIESLRTFDTESQRSLETIESFSVLPAHEFPLTQEAISRFRQNWRTVFEGRPTNSTLYNDVGAGLAPAGIEYYLPLFFESTATLIDYLPVATLVICDTDVAAAAEEFSSEVAERYEQLRHDTSRPLLTPDKVFCSHQELLQSISGFARVNVLGLDTAGSRHIVEFAARMPTALPVDARASDPLAMLRRYLSATAARVLIAADSPGRRETLAELLSRHGFPVVIREDWQSFLEGSEPLALSIGNLRDGAELVEPNIAVVAESQLFGQRAAQTRRRRRATTDPEAIIRNLTELDIGSPVVHEQYGVGRYQGLETLEIGGATNEFIKLLFADNDKLYVPVSSLHLLSRYSGMDPEHAPLHKLGSGQWEKARRKAAEKIRDVAAELLEIYAKRAARRGHAFKFDENAYQTFAQTFPFEETPDQEAAIAAVLADMRAEQPMDRLVCGDVGFGKTEVALRAAFMAVNDGKQVAVLVPTTLLAQQHYQTFADRFADWPVKVEQLSRFRAGAETTAALKGIREGTVDVVVGTHKLLSEQVEFKRLGLMIIDEEHRFGVRQKEQIKKLRANVDILTLTATPIPRTLNLALSGTRELSVIATPPSRRLAIKTFVRDWSEALAREAILREIGRGGQVYVVHNKVEDIELRVREIERIVPAARVRFAHGQMPERELEQVMLDFYHQRCNVLVCTTIIETGIDVPTANTMLIDRADKFGLAQLYQLRGRIGRSHHRAYAYLFIPERRSITPDAVKRLEAIEALEDLGVGFTLATHDLEIRGAGEILGDEQSGHIQEIGFGLYNELLMRTVAALKAGREPALDMDSAAGTEVDLHLPALLPEDYLPDVHARLTLYKRIASAVDLAALDGLREEVVDRFGPAPPATQNLFRITAAKLRAERLGIRKIDLGRRGGSVMFHANPTIDPGAIIKLLQSPGLRYRMEGGERLRINKDLTDDESRFRELEQLLEGLAGGG